MKLIEKIHFLENTINLKLTPKELKIFKNDLITFNESLKEFDNLKLKGIEPADLPFVSNEVHFRDDEPETLSEIDELLINNSRAAKGDYFVLKNESIKD